MSREQTSPRCGCGAKVAPVSLARIVGDAFSSCPSAGPPPTSAPEDCAVVQPIRGSLLMTNDFGPLVGPYMSRAGRIAATHALSDVFAMGGTPVAALAAIVADPALPRAAVTDVLSGIVAACRDNGVQLVGGHTAEGPEAMAGLTVLGAAGDRILMKRGARAGDAVLVSKPVGVGLVVRAWRQGSLEAADLEEALASMEASNGPASRAAIDAGVVAMTDVTGCGLLGHLAELLAGDRLGAVVSVDSIPRLGALRRVPEANHRSRWIDDNLAYCRSHTRLVLDGEQDQIAPLLDPQTSGGLLAVAPADSVSALRRAGFHEIGTIIPEQRLEVRP